MNEDNMKALSQIRLERAKELLADANELLSRGSYKSANNRAFYAAEKAIKAVLSSVGRDAESHVGLIKTFNIEFVRKEGSGFSKEDLRTLQSLERIRNASDYDDFYIADKNECIEQVRNAEGLIAKAEDYLKE
ncbi:MAG: HEPN domain-containing protein [Lachnospiraceae bacterium]|nr:HEPN domain-containing protein [Lachnospiraceae bacterium]